MVVRPLRWRAQWLSLGWFMVTGMVFLSLVPHPPQPLTFEFADKLQHAAGFAWLALWFLQIVAGSRQLHVIAGLLLLGIAIEVAQSFTPARRFELADIGADAAGILLGVILVQTRFGSLLAGIERRLAGREAST